MNHDAVTAYYENPKTNDERLIDNFVGRLEFARTQELLRRMLKPNSRVIDIGGGVGTHAQWLAQDGHSVLLVDPSSRHIRIAKEKSNGKYDVAVGRVPGLKLDDSTFDASLLFGPLYHLTERSERIAALQDSRRVTATGGLVAGAVLSRPSAAVNGAAETDGVPYDAELLLCDGTIDGSRGFTHAHFAEPAEAQAEFEDAGLIDVRVYGIEGPLWSQPTYTSKDKHQQQFQWCIRAARLVETHASILGASCHLLVAGTNPLA